MKYSEFGLIDKIKSLQKDIIPDGVVGIGDDAAIIPIDGLRSMVITTDAVVEGIHFKREWSSAFQIGRKSVAVNISDVAAMGAAPYGIFLTLSIPYLNYDNDWINDFIRGVESYGVPILGGDTTSSQGSLFINITAIGIADNANIKKRSTANPGDILYVTGTLGNSGAGLYALEHNIDGFDFLKQAHRDPRPCTEEGIQLGKDMYVTAMMDLSDGLAGDIKHITSSSDLSAVIDCNLIPISDELRQFCSLNNLNPLYMALCSGEDYQLLFAVSGKNFLPLHATKIGYLTTKGKEEITYLNLPEDFPQVVGYTHF